MKILKILGVLILFISTMSICQAGNKLTEKPTAAAVFEHAKLLNFESSDQLKQAYEQLSPTEKTKLIKMAMDDVRMHDAASDTIGMYILAIILPPLAVTIHTDLGMPTLWNIMWTCIFWVPGVIHAFYILSM